MEVEAISKALLTVATTLADLYMQLSRLATLNLDYLGIAWGLISEVPSATFVLK
jgi:hypothetical protein